MRKMFFVLMETKKSFKNRLNCHRKNMDTLFRKNKKVLSQVAILVIVSKKFFPSSLF